MGSGPFQDPALCMGNRGLVCFHGQTRAGHRTPKPLRPLPNTWAGFPKPGKTSKPCSNSANSMTMSALEEKRKSHILKNNEEQKQSRNHMGNNQGQKLAGKIAVITGGSSGIGLATAKRFVEEGAHVVITGRREKELKGAAASIQENVTTVVGDVSRLEDLGRLYAVVKEKHGHIDVLFANAGGGTIASLATSTEAQFDQTFDVNVKGLFFTVQKALPLFKDGGSIILTSSNANELGVPGLTAYAASKAAVRSFARGWTMELKDRKIRVNSLSPGPIETSALEKVGLPPEQVEQAIAGFTSQVPLGRRGKPEEIAAAVVVLASDESSYITGVDLAVDGGMAQV